MGIVRRRTRRRTALLVGGAAYAAGRAGGGGEPDYDDQPQLYIDPDECIDCDACVEACPVDACFAEDQLPEEWQKYTQINLDYYKSKA